MDNEITIGLAGEDRIDELWTVATFNLAYYGPKYLKGCSQAYVGDPAQQGNITLRCVIQKSAKPNTEQKFIIGIRFHEWGKMTTLDLVSLDEGFHKNIVFEHLGNLDWKMFDHGGIKPKEYEDTMYLPFIFTNGHITIDADSVLSFSDISGDHNSNLLLPDASSLAVYIAKACGMDIGTADTEKGEKFIATLLQFLQKHKGDEMFYENLVEHVYAQDSHDKKFTRQQANALITMKAYDRSGLKNIDVVQATSDELSAGNLAKFIFRRDIMTE